MVADLLIEKYEIHLDEDEGHLENGPEDGEDTAAVRRAVHVQLEEERDLDSGVDHAADAKHWKPQQ